MSLRYQIRSLRFSLADDDRPGEEQQYAGTYLVRGSLPDGVRQLNLTYDFRLLK